MILLHTRKPNTPNEHSCETIMKEGLEPHLDSRGQCRPMSMSGLGRANGRANNERPWWG
jgi:hypothetical protein